MYKGIISKLKKSVVSVITGSMLFSPAFNDKAYSWYNTPGDKWLYDSFENNPKKESHKFELEDSGLRYERKTLQNKTKKSFLEYNINIEDAMKYSVPLS